MRNARAQGGVTLKKGRQVEAYRIRSLMDSEKPEILTACLDSFKLTVQRYFTLQVGSPVEATPIADRYPVFELVPSPQQARP